MAKVLGDTTVGEARRRSSVFEKGNVPLDESLRGDVDHTLTVDESESGDAQPGRTWVVLPTV